MTSTLEPVLDYSARIIADSVSPQNVRLTTMEVVIPRYILSEWNTHRSFSRNSASSRAIRTIIMIRRVLTTPFIPKRFGLNQKGMQSSVFIGPEDARYELAKQSWLDVRDQSVLGALELLVGRNKASYLRKEYDKTGTLNIDATEAILEEYEEQLRNDTLPADSLNIHKQYVNRLLENWTWQTIIVTATDWDNFFALRDNKDAQEEIAIPAALMKEAMKNSQPEELDYGQFHLPFIRAEEKARTDVDVETWKKVSSSRCAGVSFLTHGQAKDLSPELNRFVRLAGAGHMSPLEHVGTPAKDPNKYSGNFRGWEQWRKSFKFEDNFGRILEEIDKGHGN